MSDDICERLVRFNEHKQCISTDLEVEAADEITRLREEVARLQNAINGMLSELNYLIEREIISDIRHRIAFVEARAAIREGEKDEKV